MSKVKDRRFLIVGGASLIGAYTADLLLKQGAAEVRLFDNFATGTPQTIAHLEHVDRVRIIRGDALRLTELLEAAQGVDTIFALASFLTSGIAQNAQLGVAVNTTGMLNALEAARFSGARRIVYASSVATYGEPIDYPVTEESPFDGSRMQPTIRIYAATKLLGEALCAHYSKAYGLEFNALRIASAYGAGQHARALNSTFLANVCRQVLRGEPPAIDGDGQEVHDYVYVTDVASACVLAAASDSHGNTLNIATGIDTSANAAALIVKRLCGQESLHNIYATNSRSVRPASTNRLEFDVNKARQTIGWSAQVSIEEGIRRLIDWVRTDP